MTVGAVPDYVKMQAAIFGDGTTSGIPEKVALLVGRRRATLETTRELIRRCEKGSGQGGSRLPICNSGSHRCRPSRAPIAIRRPRLIRVLAQGLIGEPPGNWARIR